jgi:hypothetical protein
LLDRDGVEPPEPGSQDAGGKARTFEEFVEFIEFVEFVE